MSTGLRTMGLGDLHLELRECGNQHHSLTITTDEGDGMSVRADWCYRDARYYAAPSQMCLLDWAVQLEYIAQELRRRAVA